MSEEIKVPEDVQNELLNILKRCERENQDIRRRQIRQWKKLDKFWHGVQFIFWSETSDDWIAPADIKFENSQEDGDGPFYDYVVNIYKAHGESIIAALAASVPAVRFPPDDAENEDDLITSKTYSKIADLLLRHIKAKQAILQTLFILWNQGLAAAYHYNRNDEKYGISKVPTYEELSQCENCEYTGQYDINNPMAPCPNCGAPTGFIRKLAGFEDLPKNRTCIELFGPLYVKVPYEARCQEDFGYLLLTTDEPKEYLQSLYPKIRDEMGESPYDEQDMYERIARAPSTFGGYNLVENSAKLVARRRIWIRPWEFESVADEKTREKMYKMFPDGAFVTFVNEKFAEARNESMDSAWTVCKSGLSQHIHSDPIGLPLVPVQELTNLHVNLTEETIEHGIPSAFADPDVLDFDTYGKHEARPGMIYPARRRPGENLSQGFHEGGRSTLSKEVSQFGGILEKAGQFVVGSFPSIYGGPGEGNSRTASEYAQSRQMALQRLSIIWTNLTTFWAEMVGKCVRIYVQNLAADDRYVTTKDSNYVNVWIRLSELKGKIGEVEPESNDAFPITIAQKQAMLMKFFELNNEFINAALFDPSNRSILAEAMSFPEINIPGEDQRIKQAREIEQIMNGEFPEPELDVDDHALHAEMCKNWAVSAVGLDAKRSKPKEYQTVIQHMQIHLQMEMMKGGGLPNEQSPEMSQPPVS